MRYPAAAAAILSCGHAVRAAMIPWVHLDTAEVPGGGVLKLMRRGDEFSIMAERGNELMNSRVYGSEELLASMAAGKIRDRRSPKVLIGGLGMGFTLRAALADLPKGAQITVAEIVPKVIEWARGPLAGVVGGSLDDKRVTIQRGDVGELIAGSADSYWDAVLLDVDNGPDGLTRPGNDNLYDAAGLSRTKRALSRGGVLGIWSAGPEPGFTPRLRRAGFRTEEHQVRSSGARKGARHLIWIAVRA
jgi:spermidine synthase